MPRTKGSKNKPKTVTADFATQIAEKQSAKKALVAEIAYGQDRVNAACERALAFSNAPTLRSILAILKNGQDKIPLHKTADQQHPEPVKATSPAKSSHRGITRGADAFRKGGANA